MGGGGGVEGVQCTSPWIARHRRIFLRFYTYIYMHWKNAYKYANYIYFQCRNCLNEINPRKRQNSIRMTAALLTIALKARKKLLLGILLFPSPFPLPHDFSSDPRTTATVCLIYPLSKPKKFPAARFARAVLGRCPPPQFSLGEGRASLGEGALPQMATFLNFVYISIGQCYEIHSEKKGDAPML